MQDAKAIVSRNCRGCGRPLLFASDENGKTIPLDSQAPVWTVEPDMLGELVARRIGNAYVTHFATCPKADQFSAKGRKL